MLIDIRAFGFSLTDAIWRHVESRVESALGPFAREVLKVTVRLENVSADPGVMDKRCSIVVALRRYPVQVAEGVATDLYAAVDDAAERIRGCVLRSIKRHIAMVRRSTIAPAHLQSCNAQESMQSHQDTQFNVKSGAVIPRRA